MIPYYNKHMAAQLRRRMPETTPVDRMAEPETIELGFPWLCPARHLLGYVKRVGTLRRLFLPEGHVLTGQAEIRCPVCGAVRIWPWGEEPAHG